MMKMSPPSPVNAALTDVDLRKPRLVVKTSESAARFTRMFENARRYQDNSTIARKSAACFLKVRFRC